MMPTPDSRKLKSSRSGYCPTAGDVGKVPLKWARVAPKKRRTEPARASLLTVYGRQNFRESTRVGVRGDAGAYDASGKRLGSFPSVQAATAAFKMSVRVAEHRP
jgi:hypothetical protein